jgi:hypothetical protein
MTGGARPGELMRLVAAGLAGSGFDVTLPEHKEERRLRSAGPGPPADPGAGTAMAASPSRASSAWN